MFCVHLIVCVKVVPVVSRSSSLVPTANDTPRTTTPLTAIQLSTVPQAGSPSLNNEPSRPTCDDRHSGTDVDQTTSHQKQIPCLLPADNFGLFFSKQLCISSTKLRCEVCSPA